MESPGSAPTTPVAPSAAAAALAAIGAGVAAGWTATAFPDLFRVPQGVALSPALVAGAGLGIVATVAILRRPALAVALLVAFVYLNLSQVLVREHGMPSLLQLLALPIGVAALLAARGEGLARAALHPLPWALAAWIATLLVASTRAWEPAIAGAELAEAAKGFVIFLLAALLVAHPRRLRVAAASLVATATLLSLVALWQIATGDYEHELGGLGRIKHAQIYGDVFEERIAGPLGDPNYFAQILLIALPLTLLPGWAGEGRARRWSAYACAAAIVAATIFTYSRGGALVLALVLALVVLVRGISRRLVAIGALLALGTVALLPGAVARRVTTLRQLLPGHGEVLHPDSSIEKRKLVTAVAWEMFLDHPVLGVGPGNYAPRFGPYAARVGSAAREYDDPFEPQYPHSLYLEVAAESGVVGLLAFTLAMVAAFGALARARHRFRRLGEPGLAQLAAALAIGLGAFLLTSVLLHGNFLRYLWLLLGLAAGTDLLAADLRRRAGEAS